MIDTRVLVIVSIQRIGFQWYCPDYLVLSREDYRQGLNPEYHFYCQKIVFCDPFGLLILSVQVLLQER